MTRCIDNVGPNTRGGYIGGIGTSRFMEFAVSWVWTATMQHVFLSREDI